VGAFIIIMTIIIIIIKYIGRYFSRVRGLNGSREPEGRGVREAN
jgi:hypothetical protein